MMIPFRHIIVFLILFFGWLQKINAQESNFRRFKIATNIPVKIDTMVVAPNTLELYCGISKLSYDQFTFIHKTNEITVLVNCSDSILIQYRVLPFRLETIYQKRDSSFLYLD